jgi:ATP-binding cassette subfamily B protein
VKIAARPADIPALLLRLWHHLTRRRRRQFLLLLGLMLASAIFEVISLGAVLPFLGILTTPDLILQRPSIREVARTWGITSPEQLLLPITAVFIGAAVVAGVVRALLLWANIRLAFASGADLSVEMYRRTLNQPYWVHLARNSSEVISGITSKANAIAFGVLLQLFVLISSIVLLFAIVIALIVINPLVAGIASISFGACYGLVTWLTRRQLRRNSQRIAHEETQVIKALQEGLGGIRDVILDGTQQAYCDAYVKADQPLRRALGNNLFVGSGPRIVLEVVAMVLIAILAYVLSRQVEGLGTALPVLGALAVGTLRLLPAFQQSYGAWTSMAGNQASLADVVELLGQPLREDASAPPPPPFPFKRDIRFEAVRFRYSGKGPWVLDGLDLTIPKGARIGIVGSTGSGKTTTLDLLMGLLMPTEGEIRVDGLPIRGAVVRAWQRTIAHVPQNIYLADSTLAENIAFGIPREAIDFSRLREATRQAQIADTIESMSDGYDTRVGERGVRLSGGQRQRIGIARALYKQASVLVFDEATSALDSATEQAVMDSIQDLHGDLTVLLIAHRLSSLRRCDAIIKLERGRIVAHGSYEQLFHSVLGS